jgi:hypothetical protein
MKTATAFSLLSFLLSAGVASAQGPAVYPDEPTTTSTRSRAEVIAEYLEARRLGLVSYGEAPLPVATPEQEQKIAEAGRRAAEQSRLAAK